MSGKREFDKVSDDSHTNEVPDELKAPIQAFKARVVDDTSSTLTALELCQLGYKSKKNIQPNLRKLNPRKGLNQNGEEDNCVELVTALMGKYPKFKFCSVDYRAHRLACALSTKKWYTNHELEASHICNNTECCKPSHLVWETPDVNKSRLYCRLFRNDPKHYCLHEPQCIYPQKQ
jgi:hypothetical protein